ncbi:glycerol-3-phosphate acyltransferase 2 [Xylanibacillus composti]|uniref:Glycerol-3-phosphate acyltransferase n=1 Tax=Xylanibacillus composti TaxID=1572762 RepID=A0A8J4H7A5_9BACL|nr:glycerol-3-phosphate acyltransferase 2 [Xylanibacillus composti]
MLAIVAIAASYLLGSITFSFVVAKWWKGIDIRKHGSGNAGATNTLRVLGKGAAITVLALDVGKGIAAVWLGRWLGDTPVIEVACGLAAIIGHNWPVFFGFRGGKGIATTIGVMATLHFVPALLAGIIAILSIVLTRYVSLGSLLFTCLTPLALWLLDYPTTYIWSALMIFAFALLRHRSNVTKLLRGEENKLGAKRGM